MNSGDVEDGCFHLALEEQTLINEVKIYSLLKCVGKCPTRGKILRSVPRCSIPKGFVSPPTAKKTKKNAPRLMGDGIGWNNLITTKGKMGTGRVMGDPYFDGAGFPAVNSVEGGATVRSASCSRTPRPRTAMSGLGANPKPVANASVLACIKSPLV